MSSFLQAVTLAACCILFLNGLPVAGADLSRLNVNLATSDDSESTRGIVKAIKTRIPLASVLSATQITATRQPPNTVHVAIGPAALRALASLPPQTPPTPIVSVDTSSLAYRQILAETQRRRDGFTAIYTDPSPTNQLRLIQTLYQRPISVAVLLQASTHVIPVLRDAAAHTKIDLTIYTIGSGESVYRALNNVSNRTVLLAIPDTGVYNNDTIRNLLIASYRREQAVVGFSPAVVKAGALATTTSDSNDIAAQLVELLDDYTTLSRLPSEQFPKYFSVVINDSVARSLNLVIDDEVRQLARRPEATRP